MNNNMRKILRGLAVTLILTLPNLKGKGEISENLPVSIKDMTYQEINEKGIVTSNINFRLGPGSNYDKISIINEGDIVKIIALMENGWYLIDYNGIIGFVLSKYIKVIDINKVCEEIMNLPAIINLLVATKNVNIREYPDLNSQVLGVLEKGNQILLNKKYNEEWYECLYHNKFCYISSKYVKEISKVNGEYQKIVFCKNDANLYDYPYNNIINSINQYELFKVFGEVEDYYLVECNNMAGYIKKIDCENIKGKIIVVDISSQKLKLFDDTDIILESDVVTGKNTTPTSLGCYSIKCKEKDRILKGIDYQTFVKYWMNFNNGQGFHDASWRNKFGGDIYINHGSHGCVNLPEDFTSIFYDNISVGDKVLIKR